MSHLPAERLAALADHSHCPDLAPTPAERAHLDQCPRCAREIDAYARLVSTTRREVDRETAPLAPWAGIAAALRSEGLIVEEGRGVRDERGVGADGAARIAHRESGRAAALRFTPASMRWAGRIAAGLMLAAAGAVAGRASAGPTAAAAPTPVDTLAAAGRSLGTGLMHTAGNAGVLLADTAARFASTSDALAALASAEHQYERAAAFLVEHDSSSQPTDSSQLYRARLAALDNVMAATREALYDAPHDPLINRYYLATMGAREATLRQLGTALPQGERISRY